MPALWLQLPSYRKPTKPKRKPLRRVSKAMAKRKRVYNKRTAKWLIGKTCAVFPYLTAREVHHRFGRIGKLLMWVPGWVPVSREGHAWIHRNVKEAKAINLIARYESEWNSHSKAQKRIALEVKPENCLVTAKSLLEKT